MTGSEKLAANTFISYLTNGRYRAIVYHIKSTIESRSSGQGAIPDRRYSPRAPWRMIWCDSKTDSRVWMREVNVYTGEFVLPECEV